MTFRNKKTGVIYNVSTPNLIESFSSNEEYEEVKEKQEVKKVEIAKPIVESKPIKSSKFNRKINE